MSTALRLMVFFTVLLGFVYPVMMVQIGEIFFKSPAEGSVIYQNHAPIGSSLIGQSFESEGYFWGRPSAVSYNPMPSGASNLSPNSEAFQAQIKEREAKFKAAHGDHPVPQELLMASGSGLDPHISPVGARYQAERVAKARNLSPALVLQLIEGYIENSTFGIVGEPRVNVLELNLALDQTKH